jgi:regulator of sirC expression with transglutaminase-like and TPR domain
MPTPIYCRPLAFEHFQSELPAVDTTRGLFRAAFAISLHERPEAQLAEAEATIERLASTVRARVRSGSSEALLAHLHDVLFDVFGLCGNTDDYYNPANSYLADVLRTHQGLPISLVLIYKCVAEPLGIRVYGINSPGHFLAEIETPEHQTAAPMYVDPFFGGGLLTPEEVIRRLSQATGQELFPSLTLLSRASHRQWLARMLTNLQAAFTASGQDRNALAMQELFLLLSD